MPETQTREPEAEQTFAQPEAPAPPKTELGDISSSLLGEARAGRLRAGAAVQEAERKKAEAIVPAITETRGILASARPPLPAVPTLTPPPSRQLTDFLAPVEGEHPSTSILKFIQAMGLFATGISGLARKDARASMAALTGALQGWHEGAKERADRHFADWQAKTTAMLKQAELDRQRYQDVMGDREGTLQEKLAASRLIALEHDQKMVADLAAQGQWDKIVEWMTADRNHADTVRLLRDRMAQAKELSDRAFDEKVREFNEKMAFEKSMAASFTPDAIEMAAQLYYRTGQMPPMGWGRSGVEVRAKILNRAAQLGAAAGADPGDLATRQAFYKGTQAELNRVLGQRGIVLAFAGTADRNLTLAETLSAKVDRTGAPVYNRWLLAGRRSVAGDPDVAAFDAAVRVAVNEFAKVTSSATGGGVTSDQARKEVEEMLNVAQTQDQFTAVVKTLRTDMENRTKGYDTQIESIRGALKTLGPAAPAPMKEPLSRKDPRYQQARDQLKLSDSEIEQRFGLILTD